MRRILFIIIFSFLSALPFVASSQIAPKRIVVSIEPGYNDMEAALELQYFLKKGGINTYIVSRLDSEPQAGSIYVGDSPYVNVDDLADGGYVMYGDGETFLLCGKGEKGTLYAVYDFLERYCGFRLYTPDALVVPDLSNFTIPVEPIFAEQPAFSYREVSYHYPNHSQLYADWHHINTVNERNSEWGMFVHTFRRLVSPELYFERHPEWFSMRDGQRVRDGQLCLSNPDVLDTLCNALSASMASLTADGAAKHFKYWSVSPNDNYNVCQCPGCLHMDSLYGGPTGTLLHFVNQVARRFPETTIATLAYQYTRSAPEDFKVRPDSNVLVMLCPIEAGREQPISTNPDEAAFRKDISDWNQITDNIFLWDYVVQFRNFWNPFPNLHVLKSNLQFFHNNGVTMMFEQASGADNVTSWMDIRCYLIAKLMWNPYLDANALIDDFCQGYYGEAGRYIKNIIDTMTTALIASGKRLDIYGYSIDGDDGYLSPEKMMLYRSMMRQAYAATDDSIIHERLRFFELSLDFATVELTTSGSFLEDLFPSGELFDKIGQLEQMLQNMVRDLKRFGVTQMMEMGCTPDEYKDVIEHFLFKTYSYGLTYFKPVTLRKEPTPPYTCDGGQSLTDGAGGILDYRYWWLGFYGDTLDAVISLGNNSTEEIRRVSMDFYFYPLSWIFLPQSITYYISNDQRHWKQIGKFTPDNPEILATPMIKTFTTTLDRPAKAEYLRVVAIPLPEIPAWHRATGKPAWIFTDEIVVE
ncbi:MAG: DUF4838 domain-containing protein [Bacteroidales bacterium]|nr:DUF4838 domain-containing protein [Bacteroidales bacterium]